MAKITIAYNAENFHVYQPSDSRRWITYRVTSLGCEIAEYEDLGNGEVKKYTLAHYQVFNWVKQDKDGIQEEIIKTPTVEETPAPLDPYTQAALEERDDVEEPVYQDMLKGPTIEDDEIPQFDGKKPEPEIVDQYNELKAKSDAKKPKGQCQQCGTQFIKAHPNKKYCNSKCKDAFHNEKRNKTVTPLNIDDCDIQDGGIYDYPKD